MRSEITLSEEFDNQQGKLVLYDTFDTDQREAILAQSHVDIRIFEQQDKIAPIPILNLDNFNMGQTDTHTMQDLEGSFSYHHGEQWTAGICTRNPDRNNLRELQLACTAGIVTATQSVIFQQTGIGLTNTVPEAVDLLTGFDDTDTISIALPGFPLASLDLSESGIDFTSNPTGDFAAGPTASVNVQSFMLLLALTNTLLDSSVDGIDNQVRFPRGDINHSGLDLSKITGVRFRFKAVTNCLVRIAALRLLGPAWQYAPYDLNTRTQAWELTPSPNGSILYPYTFPNAASWPTLWKANDPPNVVDPRPIDGEFSIDFNTGSLLNATGIPNYGVQLKTGHINMSDPASLQLTGPLTLETWINPDGLIPGDTQGLFSKWDDVNGQRGFRLGITASGELTFQCSSDGTAVSTATSTGASITPGVWQYVACTFNSGTVVFYKNGPAISTVTGLPSSIFNSPRAFRVGAWLSTS